MVAETDFSFNLIAVGNGNVVHLVAETDDEHVLSVGPADADALPYGDAFESLRVFPVAGDNLAAYTHAGADVSELTVAVGTLVKVHEVHVHCVPRYFGIILGVEVEQGFGKNLESVDPHLGWREGVHPCDDAGTTGIVVGCLHDILDFVRGVGCALIYDFDRQES